MCALRAVFLNSPVSLCLLPVILRSRTNETIFHSPYTLPSSVSCKSRVCHSYENLPGCTPTIPIPILATHHSLLVTCTQVLSFHSLAHSLHSYKTQPISFQSVPHSFAQNHPGINEEKQRFLTAVGMTDEGGASLATTKEKEMAP